ncbi:MAG: hypothetical protein U0L88_05420, partial [Acutalibacteraceae bacterium]|nr:hypothetical protein [Acutalibacteraceae bacterium]
MKKIVSVILSVTMLCGILYIPLTAGASGLSTGTRPVFDPNCTAVFNDFEDESIRGFDYRNQGNFTIANTGDSNYGYAFRIANNAWQAIDGNVTSGGITLFNESLTIGQNYIMSYDYKNINASYSGTQPVSFAPKHNSFSIINSIGEVDYYDYPTFYDNTNWYKHTVGFTASQDSLKPKINTCYGVGVYMDNFLVVEAAKFKDLTRDTATVEA